MYDIIIIGAGPAGLTAAIYARRADKKVLLLEKENFGGQITFSPKVENYPGFIQISGSELADHLLEQVTKLGADIELAQATGIIDGGNTKTVITDIGQFEGHAVILATGARHRHLGVEGENALIGQGISFCAVCDGAFYAGQDVAVIGGGNSALVEAIMLSEYCKTVTIIQNLSSLTGEAKMARLLEQKDNVNIVLNTVVTSFAGDEALKAVNILNTLTDERASLSVDGVFIAIGHAPENDDFKDIADLDKHGYIIADEKCTTGTRGIFVAGDCRTKSIRQITTATSDGAVAALAACNYIDTM